MTGNDLETKCGLKLHKTKEADRWTAWFSRTTCEVCLGIEWEVM